ncbi:hypothetical protein FVE85_0261 [Porphyridium purpureum]|uniref:Uncharacterized protein n=1 Tax=Porphyridium purpureum TaxID=35688 RepID=A0A5J4Z0D9_PORPP|nr:hypothetical protein FVE85_0261 [Porphyridium purpureum]|eukprot:POR8697..scf208_2
MPTSQYSFHVSNLNQLQADAASLDLTVHGQLLHFRRELVNLRLPETTVVSRGSLLHCAATLRVDIDRIYLSERWSLEATSKHWVWVCVLQVQNLFPVSVRGPPAVDQVTHIHRSHHTNEQGEQNDCAYHPVQNVGRTRQNDDEHAHHDHQHDDQNEGVRRQEVEYPLYHCIHLLREVPKNPAAVRHTRTHTRSFAAGDAARSRGELKLKWRVRCGNI